MTRNEHVTADLLSRPNSLNGLYGLSGFDDQIEDAIKNNTSGYNIEALFMRADYIDKRIAELDKTKGIDVDVYKGIVNEANIAVPSKNNFVINVVVIFIILGLVIWGIMSL